MYLIIILLLIFIGYPLLKLYLTVRAARRRFDDMFGAQQRAYSAPGKGQKQRPGRRTKIITRDVGEYIEFEDLPGAPSKSYTSSSSTYVEISQVENAEWEDISPAGSILVRLGCPVR